LFCFFVRALSALKEVGLDDHVKTEYGIPMYARMIHNKVRTRVFGSGSALDQHSMATWIRILEA
jgi:hypothetical protein